VARTGKEALELAGVGPLAHGGYLSVEGRVYKAMARVAVDHFTDLLIEIIKKKRLEV